MNDAVSKREEWSVHRDPVTMAFLKKKDRWNRWTAPCAAEVSHKKYGKVIVPCLSKLAAIENAAEVWGCDWLEIREACVMVPPPDGEVIKMTFVNKRRTSG